MKSKPNNRLLEQVRFIKLAQRKKGDELSTHCVVRYGRIVAFNRTIAAGGPIIEDDLDCCPQTETLALALERCGEQYQLVQTPESLLLRSGEFQAYIPLCDPGKLAVAVPDAPVAPLGDAFRHALGVAGSLVKESAVTLLESAVQTDFGTCIATNGYVILQTWHGFDMPKLLLPRAFVDALVKTKKRIVSFGFGESTFTVHFEDESWLRTNRYKEAIPDIASKLVESTNAYPIPDNFFAEASLVARWSEDGRLYVFDNCIRSHKDKSNIGAYQSVPIAGLLQGVSYSIAALRLIDKHARSFDDSHDNLTMFYGEDLRGAIAHDLINKSKPSIAERRYETAACSLCSNTGMFNGQICDCQIPF